MNNERRRNILEEEHKLNRLRGDIVGVAEKIEGITLYEKLMIATRASHFKKLEKSFADEKRIAELESAKRTLVEAARKIEEAIGSLIKAKE